MTTLLNSLCQGALLTLLVWLLHQLLPGLNAATRYAVWWITFIVVAILPLRGPLLQSTAGQFRSAMRLAGGDGSVPSASSESVPGNHSPPAPFPMLEAQIRPVDAETTFSIPVSRTLFPVRLTAKPISGIIGAIWTLLSAALLIRLAINYRSMRRLKFRAGAAPERLRERLRLLGDRSGVKRRARLLVSDNVAAPMALGLFDPTILIPRSVLEQMSSPDFDHIALHELAHLRRYDDWVSLMQQLLIALMPIQPALLWIGNQLTLERETACDDWVIAVTGAPKPYVAALTHIAELSLWARCGVLASGAAGRPSQLYRRIQRLLDKRRNAAPRISAMSLGLATAALSILAWLTLSVPQMVALADTPPAVRTDPSAPVVPPTPSAPLAPAAPLAAPAAPSAPQASDPGTLSKTFAVQPGDKLVVLADFGNIHVGAWDQNNVQMTVTHKGHDVADFLRHEQITMDQDGREVELHMTYRGPNSDVQVEYAILVPRKFDANLKVGAGDTEVAELQGTLDVTTGSGNVNLRKVDGPIDGRTGNGNVDAATCAGTLQITTGTGNIDIHEFRGSSLTAQSGNGNISAELLGALNADSLLVSGMGNVDLKLPDTLATNLSAATGMGNVNSKLPLGPMNGGGPALKIQTGMGNIEIQKHK